MLKIIKNRRDYNWDDPFNDTIDSKIDRLGERYDQYRVLKKLDESVFKKVQKKAYSYNDLNKISIFLTVTLFKFKNLTVTFFEILKIFY